MPGAAASVAAAPHRGNPLARRGTWQRLLALGDGRIGGVREHAIHAVAEHRRVQVGIGVGQGINMHEQPRLAQPLQAIRISLGSLGANAISARGNRRDFRSLTGSRYAATDPQQRCDAARAAEGRTASATLRGKSALSHFANRSACGNRILSRFRIGVSRHQPSRLSRWPSQSSADNNRFSPQPLTKQGG